MTKQLRTPIGAKLTIDEWSRKAYPVPAIPKWIFGRHVRRRSKYRYNDGTAVIDLENGWYVHSYRNGIRMLSVLPF